MDFRGQGREGRRGRLARGRRAQDASTRAPIARCSPAAAATPPSSRERIASIDAAPAAAAEPSDGRGGRGGGRGGGKRPRRSTSRRRSASISRLRQTSPAADEFFDVPVQPGAGRLRRAETQGGAPGAAAVVPARRRVAHLQRRRRLRDRPDAAHPERRRHRRGQRSELKDTYVAFGAHYDHVGYADGGRRPATSVAPRAPGPRHRRHRRRSHLERRRRRRVGDRGADGAGAGRFATGTAAEAVAAVRLARRRGSAGCYGSRYFADYPTVPIDAIVAQLNIDMIGRNRDDKRSRGEHRVPGRLRSHQQRAARDQPRGERALAAAADARLRDERSARSRAALLPERPLQLRGEGHSGHLLHDRAAPRLPRQHRRSVEDRVRQADAHRRPRLRDRRAARQPRSRAGARQPRPAGREGDAASR